MRKLILLASAAAMAAALPALAEAKGGGQGKGGPAQAQARGGGHGGQGRGNGRAERGPQAQQHRGARAEQRRGRRNGNQARAERGGKGQGQARHADRVERQADRAERRIERQADRVPQRAVRDAARGQDRLAREARRADGRDWSGWMSHRARGGDRHFGDRFAYLRQGRALPVSVADGGCPPGLAKQNAFCLPPGQLRKAQMMGQHVSRDRFSPVPDNYLYRFQDEDDFYHLYDADGFIYRIARENDIVSSIFPLFASNLIVGEPLPLGYDVYNLPVPYRDQYVDSDDYLYRYDNNAIYRVDSETRLIESVVALLTGNPLSVGSPLPTGYDVYNVPFDYRDRYTDSQDAMYRYSDGAIYQVDPTTKLVEALVQMIG